MMTTKKLSSFLELSFCHLKEFLREPAALVWAIVFPLSMLTILGVIHNQASPDGKRYIDFLAPGIICLVMMNSCLWGIAYNLVGKRMKKNLKRMIAAPLNKAIFILSFFSTRLLINLTESLIIYGYAHLVFDVNLTGSLFSMCWLYLAGHFTFTALAFLMGVENR